MKGGIGWKLIAFALDRDPWLSYLIFLFREIYIKLCQIYTKIHINSILYRHRRFKQIIFSEHATNLKTKISKRNLVVTWGFSNYYFIISIFIFFDIIVNIIYKSILGRKNSHQWECSNTGHVIQTETCDHYTALPLVGVLVMWFKFKIFKILHIWIFV